MAANFENYHALRKTSAVHQGGFLRRARKVMGMIDKVAKDDPFELLDIGTADGNMLELLERRFPIGNVQGLEYNFDLLKVARARGLRVARADARRLPFPNGCFDLVTVISTLKHVPQFKVVLSEVSRVLRPGGHVIISDPTPLGLRLGVWRGHFDTRYLHHRWSLGRLRGEVKKAGFSIVTAHRFMPFPVMVPGSDRIERALTRVGLTQGFMQQVVVGRR